MAPKKKAPEVTGPSASNPPPMERTGGGEDAGGGTGAVEPVLGPATSDSPHAPLRRRETSSVMVPMVPYARWTQTVLVGPKALRTSMRPSVPEQASRGCLDRVLLLLTWLGVRAHPAPRAVRRLCPPPQRKLSRELNYF